MRKGEETRARIVARAAELFNMRGYGGTAISDVMEAAELEKGGIYRHFGSKEELALAAFDYALGRVRQRLSDAIGRPGHAADRLLAFVELFRSYAVEPPLAGGCPVLNTSIDSDDAYPPLRERARAAVVEWQAALCAIVTDGVARGELRPDADSERLATLLIATMEGAVMMSRILADPRPLHWAADHMGGQIERLRLGRD